MLIRHRAPHAQTNLSLFDALFGAVDPFFALGHNRMTPVAGPRFELTENEDNYVLRGDLPGLTVDDVTISIENDLLTLEGTRKTEVPEGYEARRAERGTLTFKRSFRLGDKVDGAQASAKLADGVLELTLPKRPEQKPHKIAIQSA